MGASSGYSHSNLQALAMCVARLQFEKQHSYSSAQGEEDKEDLYYPRHPVGGMKPPPLFFSPLHAAALLADAKLTREILGMGKAVGGERRHGEQLIRLFMRPDKDGYTPLHYAALGQFKFHDDGVTATHDTFPHDKGFAADHFSWLGTPKGSGASSRAHKRQRVETDAPMLPVQMDVGRASAQVVKALLEAGADPTEPVGTEEHTAIELAVRTRRVAVVHVLLQLDAKWGLAHHPSSLSRALSITRTFIETGKATAPTLPVRYPHAHDAPAPVQIHLAEADVANARRIEEALLNAGAQP